MTLGHLQDLYSVILAFMSLSLAGLFNCDWARSWSCFAILRQSRPFGLLGGGGITWCLGRKWPLFLHWFRECFNCLYECFNCLYIVSVFPKQWVMACPAWHSDWTSCYLQYNTSGSFTRWPFEEMVLSLIAIKAQGVSFLMDSIRLRKFSQAQRLNIRWTRMTSDYVQFSKYAKLVQCYQQTYAALWPLWLQGL